MSGHSLRVIAGEVLLVAFAALGCHGISEGEVEAEESSFGGEEVSSMDPKTIALMAEFKRHPEDREEVAKKLLPALKQVASDHDVAVFLGKPDAIAWHYTLFYSSSMSIHFDAASEVLHVVSDVMEMTDGGEATGREKDALEITAASSEFQARPYSRQEAAKKLIPFIKPATSSKEVEGILGRPDSKSWDYFLSPKAAFRLTIVFDPEGKLTEAEIIAQ